MSSVRSMTDGSPGKLIISFALPLMIGNLFQQFYTIADAAIVGQVLGVSAIAAVGAAEWIIWMIQGIIQGFTQGFSIQMAHEFGARDYKRLRNVIVNSAFLAPLYFLQPGRFWQSGCLACSIRRMRFLRRPRFIYGRCSGGYR